MQCLRNTSHTRVVASRPQARRSVLVHASAVGTTEIKLKMPVGVVFAQKPEGGPVFVEDLTPDGAAAKAGCIAKGDVLLQCSAVILKSGKDGNMDVGHGEYLYDNWQRVMFDCKDQTFKDVMSALKSNNPRWGFNDVVLVFGKPSATS